MGRRPYPTSRAGRYGIIREIDLEGGLVLVDLGEGGRLRWVAASDVRPAYGAGFTDG